MPDFIRSATNADGLLDDGTRIGWTLSPARIKSSEYRHLGRQKLSGTKKKRPKIVVAQIGSSCKQKIEDRQTAGFLAWLALAAKDLLVLGPEPTSRCLLEGAHCRKRFSMLKKETDSRSGGAQATKARATRPFAVATLPALCRTAVGTGWVHATADSVGLLGVPRVSVRSGCTSALDMMSTKRRSSAWTAQLVDVLSIFGTFTCLIVRDRAALRSQSWDGLAPNLAEPVNTQRWRGPKSPAVAIDTVQTYRRPNQPAGAVRAQADVQWLAYEPATVISTKRLTSPLRVVHAALHKCHIHALSSACTDHERQLEDPKLPEETDYLAEGGRMPTAIRQLQLRAVPGRRIDLCAMTVVKWSLDLGVQLCNAAGKREDPSGNPLPKESIVTPPISAKSQSASAGTWKDWHGEPRRQIVGKPRGSFTDPTHSSETQHETFEDQVETPVPLLARRSQLKTYVKAQATRTPNGRAAADPAERARDLLRKQRPIAKSRILALTLHHSTSEALGISHLAIGPAVFGLRVPPVPERCGLKDHVQGSAREDAGRSRPDQERAVGKGRRLPTSFPSTVTEAEHSHTEAVVLVLPLLLADAWIIVNRFGDKADVPLHHFAARRGDAK
ncbi:hypothetical protein AK812_SmicGene22936 [Symbiodinium microadriaticum]|uniref:Uncharacterized protein n=1 Tax=Symbiodinium microadriaticum TaxID=2951 RepID=A0A1Q9DII7_SYMMI|nr:hypothetical protein AK812_SmicGene22936 [Symbiodinium microadriaticum]